ncbi:MAG: sugar phosphate isomerase/epimerase [Acidobacteria bacterium]|nr:sugar phosphate isomerase/epimerase [Acidobacteriota bacterium]
MKHSMHNWMRPEPLGVTLERLHRFGYDGIEISGEPTRYDTDEALRLMDRYGLECWGSVTMMFEGRDLIHPEAEIRRATVQYIRESLTMTKRLGGQIFCIVPSTVGKTRPLASPAEEWAWAVEGLREVTEYAGELGITPGIEPLNRFETYFINRHDQALLLCEEVGNNLGVVLDAFHINIEEADPIQAIRNVGARLVDFHVADNNRRPAGRGHFDWTKIVGALREIGYDGHLTAEFVLTLDRTPIALMSEKRESDMTITEADLKFINDMGSGLISGANYDHAVETSINTLKSHL